MRVWLCDVVLLLVILFVYQIDIFSFTYYFFEMMRGQAAPDMSKGGEKLKKKYALKLPKLKFSSEDRDIIVEGGVQVAPHQMMLMRFETESASSSVLDAEILRSLEVLLHSANWIHLEFP